MLIFELHPSVNADFSPRKKWRLSSLKSPPTLNVAASNDSELRLLCLTGEKLAGAARENGSCRKRRTPLRLARRVRVLASIL